jgi:hypothetical protein
MLYLWEILFLQKSLKPANRDIITEQPLTLKDEARGFYPPCAKNNQCLSTDVSTGNHIVILNI